MTRRSTATLSALALGALLLGAAPPIPGTFALADGSPTTAAALVATPAPGDPLTERLDIALRAATGTMALRRYNVDMTKLLHLVIVSDDFATFMHVHPVLGSDGHFTIDQHFPRRALYHLYADAEPYGFGHQVFRFDLRVAGGGPAAIRDLAPTGPRIRTGAYVVTLEETQLRAGQENRVAVHIREGGVPASDLHVYLGARAHAVFLNATSLAYVHVHPMGIHEGVETEMAMPAMDSPAMPMPAMPALPPGAHVDPDMLLHVDVGRPGVYKLWLQFRGGGSLHVAPFVLTAR